jgi:hypothetical protein
MAGAFDYINSINFNKQDLMTDTENDELAESAYVPFLTNRSLSNFPDTILYANEMNIHNHLDNKLQFHYLLNSIRPKKRFSKWAKRQDSEDLDTIQVYYKVSIRKAEDIIKVLSKEQLVQIRQTLSKGG